MPLPPEEPWNLPAELALPRRTLHALYAERSGHGDFASYHARFGHAEEVTLNAR